MKAWDIVGYSLEGETLCPKDVIEVLIERGEASPAARDMRTEDALDQIAGANGIDRQDERTFDSGDFPKVVFASDVQDDEFCDRCGEPI